jgi:outer membrane protein assembly factor BamB
MNTISSTNLSGTRDMMFLNNANVFVVVSTNNNRFVFFNRSSNTSTNYYPFYQQSLNYGSPHGLVYINDSFFYATSWAINTVYSYVPMQNSYQWNQTLLINATRTASSPNGNHIAIDECGRFWFSLGTYGLQVFDSQGTYLANMSLSGYSVFDAIITDDYVFYISDASTQRIVRIDPNIQC